jgi:dUTP pyrophosphatase
LQVRFRVLPGGSKPAKRGAAYDLCARLDGPITLTGPTIVPVGITLELPDGYGAIVKARSSGPARHGYEAHVGLIDPEFNGREVCTILEPLPGAETVVIHPGDRVAQVWVQRMDVELVETDEEIAFGPKAGFGSTGK